MSAKVLIIEDDIGISRLIYDGLSAQGFEPSVVADGAAGLQIALKDKFAVILLDVMLPSLDGFEICKELRKNRVNTPILMLTARDTIEDRVSGLDTGADDYLPKPFDFRELNARIQALLRREKVHKIRTIHIQDLVIDTQTHEVTRGGVPIDLSHREFELLEALASGQGRVFTREMIQQNIWHNEASYSNTVDAFIRLLRKKVDDGHETKLIQTVRGYGYVLKSSEV